MAESTKICEYCGKEFTPVGRNKSRQKYCKGPHYTNCVVCNKLILIKDMQAIPKTCSDACRRARVHTAFQEVLESKYGVTHYSQCAELKAKATATRSSHADEIAAKFKETSLLRYGTEHPMQNAELKAKAEATNLERYGDKNPAKNIDVRKKISEAVSSDAAQSKYRATSLSHYNVEHPAQSTIVQSQMQDTCIEKYGVPFSSQNNEVKKHISAGLTQRLATDSSYVARVTEGTHQSCLERYGVAWPCQLPQCREAAHHTISQINKSFGDKLKSYGIDFQYELHLGAYSYDVGIPDQHICIELNPTYTHNAIGNHYGVVRPIDYHLRKSQNAIEHGFRCIHVFDWDSIDQICMLLLPKVNIYARTCSVQEISAEQAASFESQYHLQGSCRGQQVNLGLVYDSELVQLMTFGKPRYNKKYQWELLRLCTAAGVAVVGGAQRLWHCFLEKYQPDSIISYCDTSKFTGAIYSQLKMNLLYTTEPAKVWSKGQLKITDNLLRQRGFDQLFHTQYGKGTSNEQLMLEHNWLPVYDCGQQVYVYEEEGHDEKIH